MKNTMKKLVGITAAAAMSLAPMMAMAETAQSALVKGGALNLRETASLSAKVLGQFPTGTLVEIVESGDEWHKVEVGGKSGYMMAKYLSTEKGEATATVRTNTGIGLNLREEPGMDGAIIASYKPGMKVTVLQKGAAWSRVSVENKEGFMATQYLNFSSGSSSSTGSATGKIALVNNPKDTQVLNLRQTASLDGKVHDEVRKDFLHRYLKGYKRAADEGIDILGYFQWSLMDNFEWAYGYTERFGMIYVDYATQERIVKDSFYWYKEVMEQNGENL